MKLAPNIVALVLLLLTGSASYAQELSAHDITVALTSHLDSANIARYLKPILAYGKQDPYARLYMLAVIPTFADVTVVDSTIGNVADEKLLLKPKPEYRKRFSGYKDTTVILHVILRRDSGWQVVDVVEDRDYPEYGSLYPVLDRDSLKRIYRASDDAGVPLSHLPPPPGGAWPDTLDQGSGPQSMYRTIVRTRPGKDVPLFAQTLKFLADTFGHVISLTSFDSSGEPYLASHVDFEYDAEGRETLWRSYNSAGGTKLISKTFRDARGRDTLKLTTRARGNVHWYERTGYDDRKHTRTLYTNYGDFERTDIEQSDAHDSVTERRSIQGGKEEVTARTRRDAKGRPLEEINYDSTGTIQSRDVYSYPADNLIMIVSYLGQKLDSRTTVVLDPHGRVIHKDAYFADGSAWYSEMMVYGWNGALTRYYYNGDLYASFEYPGQFVTVPVDELIRR